MAGGNMFGGVLMPNSVGGLPSNETTIASLLKKSGYRTKVRSSEATSITLAN